MPLTEAEKHLVSKIADEDHEAGCPPEYTAARIQQQLPHASKADIEAWLLHEAEWSFGRENFLKRWAADLRGKRQL
jgi:hypothetical protein